MLTKKSCVLMVEDNQTDALLMERAFQRQNLEGVLRVVPSCDEAYQWLVNRLDASEGLPDLILVDIGLPGETGLEMLNKLKGTPTLATMPVAVFTGSRRIQDMVKARQLGAEWYFVKRSEPRELDQVVKGLHDLVAKRSPE